MTTSSLNTMVGALLLVASLPAVAQKPIIQFIPFPTAGIVAPTSGLCGFDILVTPQAGRPNGEKMIQFSNSTIITGPFFLTLKNLNTGRTVNENVSGPSIITFSGTTITSVATGPSILAIPPPVSVTSAAGLPAVPLMHGRAVLTIDLEGNLTAITFNGKAEDVCQMLQ